MGGGGQMGTRNNELFYTLKAKSSGLERVTISTSPLSLLCLNNRIKSKFVLLIVRTFTKNREDPTFSIRKNC